MLTIGEVSSLFINGLNMTTKDDKYQVLNTIVSVNCRNGVPFTSVCIANRMKEISMWLSNKEVARYLRKNVYDIAFAEGVQYESTTIIVGAGHSANLYHSKNYDPNYFTDRNQKATTPEDFEDMHGIKAF